MAEGVRRSRKTERDAWIDQFERWSAEQREGALEFAQWVHDRLKRAESAEAREARKVAGSAGAPPPAKPPADDTDESGEGADIDEAVAAARAKLTAQGLLTETADRT